MDGSKRAADSPIYALCPLISNIDFGAEEGKGRTEIRCVAALGKNIYLGCSDGKLMSYTLEESIDGTSKYTLTSQTTLKLHSPIVSLQLVPSLSRAIVLSNDTLFFFSLPNLEPIPSDVLRPMRNALFFAINETPGHTEPVGLVIVKRTAISFWEMRNKLNFLREFAIPNVLHVRRTGPSLCIADTDMYTIVDLSSLSHFPIHQISLSETWKILPKIEVVRPDEYLFVACTGTSDDYTKVFTMGLFANGHGEPTRSPIEWQSPPEAVCVDRLGDTQGSAGVDMAISLHMPDLESASTRLEIRKVEGESQLVQTIPLPSAKNPRDGEVGLLTLAREGFLVPANSRAEKLLLVPVRLFRAPPTSTASGEGGESGEKKEKAMEEARLDEPAGSGLTPPPTPKKPIRPPSQGRHGHTRSQSQNAANGAPSSTSSHAPRDAARHPGSHPPSVHFPTSRVLLANKNSVMGLLPLPVISQVEQLLEDGRVKDAASFLASVQAKHAKDEEMIADFRFLNLRIGIAYLFQTAFEDAGDALFRGDLDPRWLMGLWDEWATVVQNVAKSKSASTKSEEPVMVEVYSGLQPDLERLKGTTIKQIVANYSPHLKPSTAESVTGQELQATLEWSAREMLAKYLRKFRTRRRFQTGGMYTDEMVNGAVDTVSVMLYSQTTDPEELQELLALLGESSFIAPDDVREQLVENGHIASLAKMYEKKNDLSALIDLYVKVADGVWKDESIVDPIGKTKLLLQGSRDRDLVQGYALWLLKRDRPGGLKLLISNESKWPTSLMEDINLLAQIREVDAKAGIKFLEHLVLQKKNSEPSLHTQLVTSYLDSLIKLLDDPKIAESQRLALDGYLSSASRSSLPFLFHLAFETPDSDHKQVRLKLVLMLQGSNLYELESVRRKLRVQESSLRNILCLETAILDAKAGDHKSALSVLVNNLQDFISAEAYCSLGGRIITPKIAAAIGDRLNLGDWAVLVLALDSPGGSTHGNAGRIRRQGSSSSLGVHGAKGGAPPDAKNGPLEPRKAVELTRMLLEVYMKAGELRATEASRLLNAQAVNFEAVDIIPQMPATWSLDLVSSFLSRSFRRSLHEVYEGQILKQLSAGQNLQTSELAFDAFAAAGAMIEEPSGEEQDPTEGEEVAEKEASGGVEIVGASELKDLHSKIQEKVAGKRRLDHADTRPEEVKTAKPQ